MIQLGQRNDIVCADDLWPANGQRSPGQRCYCSHEFGNFLLKMNLRKLNLSYLKGFYLNFLVNGFLNDNFML